MTLNIARPEILIKLRYICHGIFIYTEYLHRLCLHSPERSHAISRSCQGKAAALLPPCRETFPFQLLVESNAILGKFYLRQTGLEGSN